jgi:hypothetical protein
MSATLSVMDGETGRALLLMGFATIFADWRRLPQ